MTHRGLLGQTKIVAVPLQRLGATNMLLVSAHTREQSKHTYRCTVTQAESRTTIRNRPAVELTLTTEEGTVFSKWIQLGVHPLGIVTVDWLDALHCVENPPDDFTDLIGREVTVLAFYYDAPKRCVFCGSSFISDPYGRCQACGGPPRRL